MRFGLLVVAVAVLVAVGWRLGAENAAFGLGFWAPIERRVALLGFVAIGLAARKAGDGLWTGAAVVLAATVLSAFLTSRGLELPEMRVAVPAALLLCGGVAAWVGGAPRPAALLVVVLGAVVFGHAVTDGLRGAGATMTLLGLAAGAATGLFAGALIGEGADRMSSSLPDRLAAAVAGVGAWLLAGALGFA